MNIKVGTASLNQTPLNWDRNTRNIIKAIQLAKKNNVKILCLPELAITGYGCEDHFLSEEVQQTALKMLLKVLDYTDDLFTCFGIPLKICNALYNVMVCVYNKEIVGIVPKQHLAGDGLHYEPRWFKPWPAELIKLVNIGNNEYFVTGDLLFELSGVVIGFEICEDAFVAGRPGNDLARRGANIILNPSASHFEFGKRVTRERLVIEGSRAFNVVYIYSNLLGNEAGRAIYDGNCLVASCGDLLAQGPFLNMERVNLTTAVIDISRVFTKAISTASFSPKLDKISTGIIPIERSNAKAFGCNERITTPIQHTTSDSYSKYIEFNLAITLGLLDYLEKSHSKGFVISLSGGADSAACAILVYLMATRAFRELGLNELLHRLGRESESVIKDRNTCLERLLTCVYQSTSNSSVTTFQAAKNLAKDVGAKFAVIDIEPIVQQYITLAEAIENRKLTWETDDLALQNIQARARAPSIWMVANLEDKLLITTSNRSEAAVGYCTMDGDTAGSIAPIGGIDKAFLLEWLTIQLVGSDSLPSLKEIVCQKPTAELRPGQVQSDEEDLMPYPILDVIEKWAIVEKKGPQEVLDCLCLELNLERNKAIAYVKKFFTLWVRNQWKREKLSVSFHVGNHSLDPKTWCRFPILSGGFEYELSNLL